MTSSRKLVVDASVAVNWYVPEVGSAQAAALLDSDAELLAPDLLVAHVWERSLEKGSSR